MEWKREKKCQPLAVKKKNVGNVRCEIRNKGDYKSGPKLKKITTLSLFIIFCLGFKYFHNDQDHKEREISKTISAT